MRIIEIINKDVFDRLAYNITISSKLDEILYGLSIGSNVEEMADAYLSLKAHMIRFDTSVDVALLEKFKIVNAELMAAGGARYMTENNLHT